jgi:lysine 2,3-aminomutase
MQNWRSELTTITESVEDLASLLELEPDETAFFESSAGEHGLPLRITRHYIGLMRNDPTGALRRMAVPRLEEKRVLPFENADPLAELPYEVAPRCIHRYRDRVLILVTGACALYCRHCFRRRFTADGAGGLTMGERQEIVRYVREHTEVHEVILSGGDPLMLGDAALGALLADLRSIRPELVLRISSRMPVVLPSRLDDALVALLASYRPLWLIIQVNHPLELSPGFRAVAAKASAAGIPLLSQTVLLRSVNDDLEVLKELFYGLIEAGVKPYYLFQGDLVPGTSHLRTSLDASLELYRRLQRELSGLALPVFAVDLPGGGGKIRLHHESLAGREDGSFLIRDLEGKLYRYPAEGS